jgi:hypothetical protein
MIVEAKLSISTQKIMCQALLKRAFIRPPTIHLTEMAEIDSFIEQQRPENTTKKTTYDLNNWQRFCSSTNEGRKL